VGMTRARNKLNIFTYNNEDSTFVKEISSVPNKDKKAPQKREKKRSKAVIRKTILSNNYDTKFVIHESEDYPRELIIGQKVSQPKYGVGVIVDVNLDEFDLPSTFSVEFDGGVERKFMYPYAFEIGMKVL
jgi:DNA helicase-2/ATP-dependent DNA helicase PcrA